MFDFLKRLKKNATDSAKSTLVDDLNRRAVARFKDRPNEGPQGHATWNEGDEGLREYETFTTRFEYQPGRNFMEFLRSERIPELEKWLHPSNPSAEAKAFIRLSVDMVRHGESIWDEPGITIFADDWARPEKRMPKEMRAVVDALATLAQMLQIPIQLFFRDKNDEMKVWDFTP
jgi:hypothetical protein